MGPGAVEDQERESGPLVFQRGKKLNDEYYIVSVRDNTESAIVKFFAYELENSETFDLCYSYADFDALFKSHPELVNPANKEGRYDWVVDRLDFTTDSNGTSKRLKLAAEPTVEEEGHPVKSGSMQKSVPLERRLTYSERTRLRVEAEKLEEKRAANIALKSEKNRKAFVTELQEKRKLEELKASARRQRIDEERAERREKKEMQKRIAEERLKRYEDNEKNREAAITTLEADRKTRDLALIRDIIDTYSEKKEALTKRLEDARQRKKEEEESSAMSAAARKEAEDKLNRKRQDKIAERNDRLKQAEREYLELRKAKIEQINQEKHQTEVKKQEYLKEKAARRAAQLREKHEKIEAWERQDDQRTHYNLQKEHARNMLMLDHIESLRQKHSQEQAEAAARKEASLQERREREAKEAEALAEEVRRRADVEQKRISKIAEREALREAKKQSILRPHPKPQDGRGPERPRSGGASR
mmetsp:Transcript_54284/g.117438  ORF Transcript_54284/g.117438 Transcript_54284/m.117438 type:complete len:474 (-) Transcript_54284:490-1911(-)